MSKDRVRVGLFGFQKRSILIDPAATQGAVVGRDLVWPNGQVVQPQEINNNSVTVVDGGGSSSDVSPTLWSLILNIPAYIKSLAVLATQGIVVKRPGDVAATMTITAADERIIVTDGNAVSGDPTIGAYDWPSIKNTVEAGDVTLVQTGFQALVWNQIVIDLTGQLTVDGALVVLEDYSLHEDLEPDFSYDGGGNLTQIDYAAGEQKVFTYNGNGDLTRVDYIRDGVTLRKDFTYTGGGDLDFITETYLDV